MKKLTILLTLLLVAAISASAALPPLRIAVTNPTYNAGATLVVDVLTPAGAALTSPVSITQNSVPTTAGGVLTFVLDGTTGSELWGTTTNTYVKNNLIRITYNDVVLSIERMEVMYAKQGLLGTYVDPEEIVPAANGDVLTTSSGITQWTQSKNVIKSANMNWFFMPSVSFDTSTPITDATKNLYTQFTTQFGTPSIKCSGAPGGYGVLPTLPAATDIYYYITYYDPAVFANITIDASGVMEYDVLAGASACSFINIVFVVK